MFYSLFASVLFGVVIFCIAIIVLLVKFFNLNIKWGLALLFMFASLIILSVRYWQQHENDNRVLKPEFTDLPFKAGRCVGWQKSLHFGNYQRMAEVNICLSQLALSDRLLATADARVLAKWNVSNQDEGELNMLINTLIQFRSDEELMTYLDELNLFNKQMKLSSEPPLTVAKLLTQYGRIHWFDGETGFFPNNHDFLLDQIATLSKELSIATFKEVAPGEYNDYDSPYQLIASFKGKEYHQVAQNYGDWYDISAVLTLLNNIAIDNQLPDRFITLPTGDQTAIVLVIQQDILKQFITKGLVPVSAENRAMLLGKSAENNLTETNAHQLIQ